MQVLDQFDVVIVPGLYGSGPGHWQARWHSLLPNSHWVEQTQWDQPDLEVWSHALSKVLQTAARPCLLAAHSFGALTTIKLLRESRFNIVGALLVAPADPKKFGVEDHLNGPVPALPALILASEDDPWMEVGRARLWAKTWNLPFSSIGRAGHINAESGLGDWPEGLAMLDRLAAEHLHISSKK